MKPAADLIGVLPGEMGQDSGPHTILPSSEHDNNVSPSHVSLLLLLSV